MSDLLLRDLPLRCDIVRALSAAEVSALAGSSTMHYASKHYEKNVTSGDVTTYYHLGGKLVALRKGTALEYLHQEHLSGTAMTTDSAGPSLAFLHVRSAPRPFEALIQRWLMMMPASWRRPPSQHFHGYSGSKHILYNL